MALKSQLEKKNYRHCVKAGLGLKYLKEGLQPLCEDIVKEQLADIIDKIKQQTNISTVTCGQCSFKNLMPDHQKVGNKQCPLGQVNCNCLYPAGKIPCPNKVCSVIHDEIIKAHGSTPPAPNWRNSDIKKWSTDPWSIAKCFINAPGYDMKSSAEETDCLGLLLLIINNKAFYDHINYNSTGTELFSKVKEHRNSIFHSSTMELRDDKVKEYIDDMIAVLDNVKNLNSRPGSETALINLKELKKEDFIITTKCENDVLNATIEALKQRIAAVELDISELKEHINEDILKLNRELENLKSVQSLREKQSDNVQNELESQRKLMELYKKSLLKVSVHPLNPRRTNTHFSDVYTKLRMVTGRNKKEISSMKELFMKDGRSVKSIYVEGEMGSGKSTFCRLLVYLWCLAHSEQQTVEDEFSGIEEMRKFDFLFYIHLSKTSDKTSIREMLSDEYGSSFVKNILDKEQRTVLIILDGLDEWTPQKTEKSSFQTEGLPVQDVLKNNYIVITTSRPWKLEALQITDNEMQLKVTLKNFEEIAKKNMIKKTVFMMSDSSSQTNQADVCETQIEKISMSDIHCTPIMLQQLICLWFDGKLNETSGFAVYSAMIKLLFEWKAKMVQKDPCFEEMRRRSRCLKEVRLPEYLNTVGACKTHACLIEEISRIAYETQLNKKKVFDNSSFENFDISVNCCLKLGILSVSEEEEEDLRTSQCPSMMYSFVHISMKEFLAKVYSDILSMSK